MVERRHNQDLPYCSGDLPFRLSLRCRVVLVAVLVSAGAWHAAFRTASPRLTSYVAPVLPQRALKDLDGDGHVDVARVSERSQISIRLSASSETVQLDGPVASLIASDVDRDGDLDLVAATPSGDVEVFLNDGRGRFTQQKPGQVPTFDGEPVLARGDADAPTVLGASAPFAHPPNDYRNVVFVSTRIRPPTAAQAFRSPSVGPASPRGPPFPSTHLS